MAADVETLASEKRWKQLASLDDTDQIVRIAFGDGQARMRRRDQTLAKLGVIFAEVEPINIRAWRHDPTHRPISKPHHTRDHFPFVDLNDAGAFSLGHHRLDFLFG